MKITIDDKPDLVSADPGSKFGDILEQLRDWLKSHRLVVTSLALDGEILSVKRQDELQSVPVDAFGRLAVSTIDPVSLSKQTLAEVRQHLQPLSAALIDITENIQRGDIQPAWLKLTTSFEVWAVIIEAVEKVAKLAEVDLMAFQIGGTSLQDKLKELTGLLGKAKSAMENQDIVTVGDLMEYEFAPRIDDWNTIIDMLCDRIDPKESG